MGTKIIEDEEHSLDELVVRARKDRFIKSIVGVQEHTHYLSLVQDMDFNEDYPVAISKDGRYLAGVYSKTNTIKLVRKVGEGKFKDYFPVPIFKSEIKDIRFTHHADYMLVAEGQHVHVFSLLDNVPGFFSGAFEGPQQIDVDRSYGRLAVLDGDDKVYVKNIDFRKGEIEHVLTWNIKKIRTLTYSGPVLGLICDQTVCWYWQRDNQLLFTGSIAEIKRQYNGMSVADIVNGNRFAFASDDNSLTVHDTDIPRDILCEKRHPYKHIAISKDGCYVLTGTGLFEIKRK
jgi:WD40 repeat protein